MDKKLFERLAQINGVKLPKSSLSENMSDDDIGPAPRPRPVDLGYTNNDYPQDDPHAVYVIHHHRQVDDPLVPGKSRWIKEVHSVYLNRDLADLIMKKDLANYPRHRGSYHTVEKHQLVRTPYDVEGG